MTKITNTIIQLCCMKYKGMINSLKIQESCKLWCKYRCLDYFLLAVSQNLVPQLKRKCVLWLTGQSMYPKAGQNDRENGSEYVVQQEKQTAINKEATGINPSNHTPRDSAFQASPPNITFCYKLVRGLIHSSIHLPKMGEPRELRENI